jgi:translation initiation factor 4G
MGNFATMGSGSKLSSEKRYANSNRAASVNGAQYTSNRPSEMQRTASQGGAGAPLQKRVRSKRGENRNENNRVPGRSGGQSHGSGFNNNMNQMQNLDPVVPLQATENRWDRKAIQVDQDSPELVERKVKGLLNKLTMEKFASISDQIIAWANKSEKEKDGHTLIQVIRLVFKKATDEATWSEMYAAVCATLQEDDGADQHQCSR